MQRYHTSTCHDSLFRCHQKVRGICTHIYTHNHTVSLAHRPQGLRRQSRSGAMCNLILMHLNLVLCDLIQGVPEHILPSPNELVLKV